MKKVVILFVVVAAIAAAVVVGRRVLGSRRASGTEGALLVRVTRRSLGTEVTATGVIKPMTGAQVNVGSTVSGIVSHLHVRIGDVVAKGQLLAELDSRELSARHDAAEAALKL
ncbi:MAG: biotin/lipoyl-binding protein, partial [Bryobacteraceae bacterium]